MADSRFADASVGQYDPACPNCGAIVAAVTGFERPPACPECCASLERSPVLAARREPVAALLADLDVAISRGPGAPRIARDEFRTFSGAFDEQVSSTATLLVSELVTNAVVHGPVATSSVVELHCSINAGTLAVEVADEGAGFVPRTRFAGQDERSGWGLHLVEQLSDAWGVDAGRPTRVWFELAL